MHLSSVYPSSRTERDRFVVTHRPARQWQDPWMHQGVIVEDERAPDGTIVPVATVFLTGRECPWRCVMCDLWRQTTIAETPAGALVRQIDNALGTFPAGRHPVQIKLYNAGSFFDLRAVPETDYDAIAARVVGFDRVIVESHPALVGRRVSRFGAALGHAAGTGPVPRLEVAMGLETAHPGALEQLNKRFTPGQFAIAADRLRRMDVDLRVFLLVGVPFVPRHEQRQWLERSIAFAFECGATAVSLIPTRTGNGALDLLADTGAFEPPRLADVEHSLAAGLQSGRGRVFADLWDLQRFATCDVCFAARRDRLRRMNLAQRVDPLPDCTACGTSDRSS
jgi:radical SAM enzyme (TIGR01210 family)